MAVPLQPGVIDEQNQDVTLGDLDIPGVGDSEEGTLTEEIGVQTDPFDWVDFLADRVGRDVITAGIHLGEDQFVMGQFFSSNFPGLLSYLQEVVFEPAASAPGHPLGRDKTAEEEIAFWTGTTDGLERLYQISRSWFLAKDARFADVWSPKGTPSLGRTGGRGGSRRPTAAEIRAQFDLDQLAARTTQLHQGLLLQDAKDPRGLARAYVDAIVANPDQKLDFDTFVRGKIKNTARYASIYKDKPDSISEEQFLQPYFQSASQLVRPKDAAKIAIGGAQFGASQQAFQARLARDDSVTGSSPFINNMQARLQNLRGIFRG